MKHTLLLYVVVFSANSLLAQSTAWREHVGKIGPTGWRCNVIQPDEQDHGPDGINIHDWDGDGDMDIFVNYEEGKYSRLYFNPGKEKHRGLWADYIEFKHGKCEDSGIGDLDNDGDIDYIANGGWIYFNPGKKEIRDASRWIKMTLFDEEARAPRVADIDGDGLNDLVIAAKAWYKQPKKGKHDPANWKKFTIGETIWPMNSILHDVDKDGDIDIVVPDRRKEIFWFVNPGEGKVTQAWDRKKLHNYTHPMFMAVADVNADGLDDFLIASGNEGKKPYKHSLIILLRNNKTGDPTFNEILVKLPETKKVFGHGWFLKGVAVTDLDKNTPQKEIVITPKNGDIWYAGYSGDSLQASNWKSTVIDVPGAETRTKMDNVYLGDIDGDGDTDIITTEENGGWGVIWFENPEK